jgi:hypothetical protein
MRKLLTLILRELTKQEGKDLASKTFRNKYQSRAMMAYIPASATYNAVSNADNSFFESCSSSQTLWF